MRLLAVATLLVAALTSLETDASGIICSSDTDCASGETCVAGDSPHPIQACVVGAVCGGLTAGNCPSDSTSGQLACIAHQGVHKCVSANRCDQYFGGASCSGGCSDENGVLCSEQGFCSIISTDSDGRPSFGCTCNDGFSGDKCESGSTTSSDSSTPSSFDSRGTTTSSDTDDIDTDDSTLISRTSNDSTSDSPSNDSTSDSPSNDSTSDSPSNDSTSDSPSNDSTSDSPSTDFTSDSPPTNSTSDSPSQVSNNFTTNSPSPRSTSEENSNVVPESTNVRPLSSQSDAKGTSSAVFVTIGVLAACIFVGALLFAMYSRKKRRDGAQADGFGGAAAFVAPAASIASDLEGSSSNDTPKSDIVTM